MDSAVAFDGVDPFMMAIKTGQSASITIRKTAQGEERIRNLHYLQRTLGNDCVQRLLIGSTTSEYSHTTLQRTPTRTRARQESKATETIRRLDSILLYMHRQSNRTTRNTARLFAGEGSRQARFNYDAMTLRHDSDAIVRDRGLDRDEHAFYFFGRTENNMHQHGPNTVGTVQGTDTVLLRGRDRWGIRLTRNDVIATWAHETSHLLTSSYGEHPDTDTDSSSLDRYKDEFRAYWIEPVGRWARMAPNDNKARGIRRHIVGRRRDDPSAYPRLRNRYWNPANTTFKNNVDQHLRPDGFNLTNNPNLDRLFNLLQDATMGVGSTDDVLSHIVRVMSPQERNEAVYNQLISTMYQSLSEEDANRIGNALTFPRLASHARQLNPSNSVRISRLLEAIAHQNSDHIKSVYRTLTDAERREVNSNAALLVFIDQQISLATQRASTYALVLGGEVSQFDAMEEFLSACQDAQIDAALGDLTDVPERIRSRLARLNYRSRLALYRLLRDIRREYIDEGLTEPVRGRLLRALREGGEP